MPLSSRCQACLNLLCQHSEGFLVMHSNVCQHLTVNLDRCHFQAVHESTVSQAMNSGGGINTHNPQGPKVTFTNPSITISILGRFDHGLLGNAINAAASAIITFCF